MVTRSTFTPVADGDALDALWERSGAEPVVLFKHDPFCSISLVAYQEVANLGRDVAVVDVARAKALAKDVAKRTGVRHESPQVIVLRDGAAAWDASHWDITANAIADALADGPATP
ncbi:MAG: hypothetical protein AVDCRST_MAG73-1256 [uncultured Thermomicrobiales bacterium]|uniref:General stress protein n=1 Tax=uncultured Thermomicrobiales bacterium TaxID=1645740 RepID=A0A6J4TXG0_9BACT|nr:MAG: hypothetical protein AVDCRST_MAG73-1256 [uncultured Thermomicrobiales bacterium]